jgi:hypothetical protein
LPQRETGGGQQLLELPPRSLAAGGIDQHVDVHEFRNVGSAILRYGVFDDQDPTAGRHCPSAILQDADALVVRPVVQNELEDIEIAAGRDRFEEVATHDLAPVSDAGLLEQALRRRNHLRHVEQNAAHIRVGLQHTRHHRAASTADIHQLADTPKAVGRENSFQRGGRICSHEGIERRRSIRMSLHVVEDGLAERHLEAGNAGLHALREAAPRQPTHRAAAVDGTRPHRSRHVRSQPVRLLC